MPPLLIQSLPKNGSEFFSRCDSVGSVGIVRRILVEVVEAQARRQPLLGGERQEGIVHRVGVLVRDAAARRVRVEGAVVEMRRDAEPGVVAERLERRCASATRASGTARAAA